MRALVAGLLFTTAGAFLAAPPIAVRAVDHAPPIPPAAVAPPTSTLAELGCDGCHMSSDASIPAVFSMYQVFTSTKLDDFACAACHVNNVLGVAARPVASWLPLSDGAAARIARSHPYVTTPALDAPLENKAGTPRTWSIQRFSSCGAQHFLVSPVPRRRRRTESMFPLPRERIERLLAVSGLEACSDDAPHDASDVNEGQRLFSKHCVGCHGALAAAPLLRLGFPLLARTYFGGRVRSGSAGKLAPALGLAWRTEGARAVRVRDAVAAATTMPAFANLSDAEVDKLYAYVSVDSSDLAPLPRPSAPPPHDVWPTALGLAVFRAVQRDVFDGSCRHCHDARPSSQMALERVLGRSSKIVFPSSNMHNTSDSALRAVLSPGPGCSESELVKRLRQRQREWSGAAQPGEFPGMPMTLPPLPDDAVRRADAWTRQGCPSDEGPLCIPCG